MKHKMKSTSTQIKGAKERMEFKGDPKKAKEAQRADNKSDKAIAKKYGVKYTGK